MTDLSRDHFINRLTFHSRRGLLELDLLLQNFAKNGLRELDENGLGMYETILEFHDWDILELCTHYPVIPAVILKDIQPESIELLKQVVWSIKQAYANKELA